MSFIKPQNHVMSADHLVFITLINVNLHLGQKSQKHLIRLIH